MEFYDPEGFFTDILNFRSARRGDMAHFNIFPSEPFCGPNGKPAPYSRRSYYKISLVIGRNVYHYANRSIDIEESALFFGNPMVPYSCRASGPQTGYFCIFTPDFFKDFGALHTYPVFQPGGDPIFKLTPRQQKEVREIFQNMEKELQGSYAYKYDSIRAMVLSLIHQVMKIRPAEPSAPSTANDRICTFFIELLERQFPIDTDQGQMQLRRPVDFADHLSVHINHLNRAVKTVTGQTTVKAYGTDAADRPLGGLTIPRRLTGAHDVGIGILYCGVCHSDLHQARNEWDNSIYPVVPGHEIVGRVTSVGNHVNKFKKGDLAAVGCMVDSCRVCEHCQDGLEQYCAKGCVQTYNDHDKILDTRTFGGYSESIVVDESFVLQIPANLDLAAVAPLLCAGITTYSPLHHWQAGPGKKVGIVGIGGLGHMGIRFARAMGAHVVVFTTSAAKVEDAKRLGAHEVVLSTDADQMNQHSSSCHFILDAVSANHDLNAYLQLLKLDGTLALVGVPEKPIGIAPFNVMLPRRNFAGSAIGSIAETQEMLEFCGKHNIVSDIEMINIQQINEAYERLLKGDVRYRFVIDMKSLTS